MDFSKIKSEKNGDLEVIKNLKKSSNKIYVYGCANQAKMVCEYLVKNGLFVKGYFVDHIFYKDNFFIDGIKVYDIDDYKDNLDDFNIVIGFCAVNKTKFLLQNKSIIKGNYFLISEHEFGYIWNQEYLIKNSKILLEIYDELGDKKSKSILKELAYCKLNHTMENLIVFADDDQYFNELTFVLDSSNEIYVDGGGI